MTYHRTVSYLRYLAACVLHLAVSVAVSGETPAPDTSARPTTARAPHVNHVPGSCTVFMASRGDTVLFGNNEDYTNCNTFYWAEQPTNGHYGGVYLSYDDPFPQGGVNEKGLTFDYNSLPATTLKPHPELPPHNDNIVMTIMRRAATVEEAITIARSYEWESPLEWQVSLVDAKGDAVVISAGADGELAFTRKDPGDGCLAASNFNLVNPTNRFGPYPCPRFDAAMSTLCKIERPEALNVAVFRKLLRSVHSEGDKYNTLYSNIVDLKRGEIYLYYWHKYGEAVRLNIAEEIAKGTPRTSIRSLFSQKTVKWADLEHWFYRHGIPPGRTVKGGALVAIVVGFVALVVVRRRGKRTATH